MPPSARGLSLVMVAAALASSTRAWADRREYSLHVGLAPTYAGLADSIEGTAVSSRVGGSLELTGLYGVTHGLHVGVSLWGSMAGGFEFEKKVLELEDGSHPLGTLRESLLTLGGGAVASWRFDLGQTWAPVLRVDGGVAYFRYGDLTFAADGTTLVFPYEPLSEVRPFLRATALVEFRFANRFLATVGISVRQSLGALSRVEVSLPFAVGLALW